LNKAVLLVFACAVTFTTAEGTRILLYAPYLAQYGYSLPAIGALSALIGVFRLLSRVPIGMAYRASRAKGQLALSFAAFGLATGGYAFAEGQLLTVVLLTIVHGFAFGSLGTLTLAVVIDLTGGRRAGAMMGWYTAALSTGFSLGAFVGGWLADAAGTTSSALAVIALLPLISALAILTLPAPGGVSHPVTRSRGLKGLLAAGARLDARVWPAFTIAVYVNMLFDTVESFFPLFGLSIGLPLAVSGVLKGLKSGAATFIRFV
jgi:MFS family permease